MAKRKLPQGFNSWIQLHDYLANKNFTTETIIMQNNYPKVSTFRINMRTVKQYAWDEIQQNRLNADSTFILMHANEMGHNMQNPQIQEIMQKVNKLLNQLILTTNGTIR